jgi:molybdenum cofactor cytidylyltransferase
MGCLLKQGGGLYARLRVGAILLAAGEGKRMGGVAKPLITLQGVPLINRHLIALSGAGVDEVVVVTGHEREAIEAQVQSFPVSLAHNADYPAGQQGSVRVGLQALSGAFDAVFVVLADQPLIAAADLTELMGAFKRRPPGQHILVPVVTKAACEADTLVPTGQRGNPIVLDEIAVAQILTSDLKLACRHLIESQPDMVCVHHTTNTRFTVDLDTPDDLQQLAKRTGWRLELPQALALA